MPCWATSEPSAARWFAESSVPAGAAADPDAPLAAAARGGDLAAADELIRRHQEGIARLLWRFARQRADLDDLVQETFVRAWRALPRWQPNRPFAHWLRHIAVNTGRDHCRREAVRRRWFQPTAVGAEEPPAPRAGDDAAGALAEAKEWLALLPPDDRTLLTLQHLDGWELGQIARALGWSLTATKVRAWRARGRLRHLLKTFSRP